SFKVLALLIHYNIREGHRKMVKTGPKISYSIPQNATKFYCMDDVSTIRPVEQTEQSVGISFGATHEAAQIS
ncbi:MAG: hypothetical protein KKH73_07155, partial [Actinobacteria bacterium]|nr:hypothetical protein [Actinomycetota bacterium]